MHGQSSLTIAAYNGSLELCNLLVDKGADINYKVDRRSSPLNLAVLKNNLDVCKFLVDKGASDISQVY